VSQEHDYYIVTGPSGTGIAASLQKYKAFAGAGTVVKVEDYLADLAAPYLENLLGRPQSPPPQNRYSLLEIFRLPEKLLRDLWPKACERAYFGSNTGTVPNIAAARKRNKSFLTFHAAWYYLEWHTFLPAPDPRALCQLPKPKLFITLIDDVYDTFVRLSRPDELFAGLRLTKEESEKCQLPSITEALLRILRWREAEVRYSEVLARTLDVPHVLFAVKHPMETFKKLLDADPHDFVYLSHPISEPRRLGLSSDEGRRDVRFLSNTVHGLREGSHIIFEPTTIDELLFKRDDSRKVISDELDDRWPLPEDYDHRELELLWDKLVGDEGEMAHQPFMGREETLSNLTILDSTMNDHMDWRDRHLVEQSQSIVIVRPFPKPDGSVARGVQTEAELHYGLAKYSAGGRPRAAVIYHPPEDEKRRRIGATISIFHTWSAFLTQPYRLINWSQVAEDAWRRRLDEEASALDRWLKMHPRDLWAQLATIFNDFPTGHKPDIVWVSEQGSLRRDTDIGEKMKRRIELAEELRQALCGQSTDKKFSLVLFGFTHCNIIRLGYGDGQTLARTIETKLQQLMKVAPQTERR
jgi:hypothetical protein